MNPSAEDQQDLKEVVALWRQIKAQGTRAEDLLECLSRGVDSLREPAKARETEWPESLVVLRSIWEQAKGDPIFLRFFPRGADLGTFILLCGQYPTLQATLALAKSELAARRELNPWVTEAIDAMAESYNRTQEHRLELVRPQPGDTYRIEEHESQDRPEGRVVVQVLLPGLRLSNRQLQQKPYVRTR